MSNAKLLGTTTLKRMIDAVYDENNPLYKRNWYSECGSNRLDIEADKSRWNETVYVYYHRKENQTIMTNIKGDVVGAMGSSAGFEGKVDPSDLAE